MKVLLYGYGNQGREDDGLGISFVEAIEIWAKEKGFGFLDFDSNYQLNIEDAHEIAGYDIVLFADASQEKIDTFTVSKVKASPEVSFTMHAVSPEFVLNLCQCISDSVPEVYLIHIKGIAWEMKEELTEIATANLEMALNVIQAVLTDTFKQPESERKAFLIRALEDIS
ncbi:MAG: hydrogenase maturation protease [Candidatus Cloacimonetes bacterium]|nr:hydrogenase maturation protease [Candidatus Cloacimonadota bacterium]